MTERTAIAIGLLALAVITVAGWALAMALKDSDQEIQTDFDELKNRSER